MEYLLGIDQGGTKTIAVVCNIEGFICGIGMEKGSCFVYDGLETAMNRIKRAVKIAVETAKINIKDIVQISAGITGVDWPEDYLYLQMALKRVFPESNIIIYNDCFIALFGALCFENAVIICAGTGLNIGIATPDGQYYALGYYINKEDHAGMALGEKIFQSVVNYEIGLTPETMLVEKTLKYYGKESIESMLRASLTGEIDKKEFKNLVPLAKEAIEEGDNFAYKLMKDFGYRICRYIIPLLKKYNMIDARIKIVVSGGVVKNNKAFMKGIKSYVQTNLDNFEIIEAKYEPVIGAVFSAYMHYTKQKPSQNFVDNINSEDTYVKITR